MIRLILFLSFVWMLLIVNGSGGNCDSPKVLFLYITYPFRTELNYSEFFYDKKLQGFEKNILHYKKYIITTFYYLPVSKWCERLAKEVSLWCNEKW